MQFLISIGADWNVKNGDGDTPLNLAFNSKACLEVLLEAGANVLIQVQYFYYNIISHFYYFLSNIYKEQCGQNCHF